MSFIPNFSGWEGWKRRSIKSFLSSTYKRTPQQDHDDGCGYGSLLPPFSFKRALSWIL